MGVSRSLSASVPVILMTVALLGACRCARAPVQRPTTPVSAAPSIGAATARASAEAPAQVRGMWAWSTRRRLDRPAGTSSLLETVRMVGLTELYLSVNDGVLDDPRLPAMLSELSRAGVRVEALSGDARWYLPEQRAAVLGFVDAVAAFNARGGPQFAGIHLDIEPHQLPENRGRHGFLPALADAIEAARAHAAERGLGTSADLPRFAFDELGARFAQCADRTFVMLYQLRERTPAWLVKQSDKTIEKSFGKLSAGARGRMVIGLRVEDYGSDLEAMLEALDRAHENGSPYYGGWAIHDEAKFRAR